MAFLLRTTPLPHKLTLAHLRVGLDEMKLESIVNPYKIPSEDHPEELFEYHSQRAVAAVVTQTFAYMVDYRLDIVTSLPTRLWSSFLYRWMIPGSSNTICLNLKLRLETMSYSICHSPPSARF